MSFINWLLNDSFVDLVTALHVPSIMAQISHDAGLPFVKNYLDNLRHQVYSTLHGSGQ